MSTKQLPDSEQDAGGSADLPLLPEYVQTKDNQLIDIRDSLWYLPPLNREADYSISWLPLEASSTLSRRAGYLVRLYIADLLSRRKSVTVNAHFYTFRLFEQWLTTPHSPLMRQNADIHFNWADMEEKVIRAFLHWRADQTVDSLQSLTHLRCLFAWGVARQYPDFSPQILLLLRNIKIKNHPIGHNVRFRHPTKGPFSPEETLLIRKAIKGGLGREEDRALVMIHLELGTNPFATVQLLNKDLKKYDNEGGTLYQIDMPRIKKRTVHRETKRRPISKELGELLVRLQRGSSEEALIHWLPSSHAVEFIEDAMSRFAKEVNLKSPISGKLLHLIPRRFRYTLATHMAEEGASKYQIAEILDHSDLQNVNVYTQTVSSIAQDVAKATDGVLGPIVKRFLGKIVDSADGATQAIIPATTPHLPIAVLNSGGVGVCGRDVRKDGLCRLFPPLSCYLCPSFIALRTGPHEEMLASIEAFIQEARGSVDERILMQLDEIRLAITEIIVQLTLVKK